MIYWIAKSNKCTKLLAILRSLTFHPSSQSRLLHRADTIAKSISRKGKQRPGSPDARAFWETYWHGLYATPRAWAHKAENLIHAFEAVVSASVTGSMHLDMLDQALMLAGMSVEVQLKAILVNVPAGNVMRVRRG